MPLSLPATLKLAQLKQLAFKCGISTSGTKPVLIRRLQDEVNQSAGDNGSKTKPVRILSIDMGIRNLAYCILDVPAQNISWAKIGTGLVMKGSGRSAKRPLPSIHAWHRLAVSSPPTPAIPIDGEDATTKTTIPKEAFDPATLSQTAYTLLRAQLLPAKPTHILIERQRFRSMGSKHILEWTVRVNMFESMIYAVLCTLKGEGLWDGSVRGVLPGKVGPFWVGEGEEDDATSAKNGKGRKKIRKSASAKIQNKGAKIDLVRSWLESGDVVQLGNDEVKEMARRYVEKWDRVPGGRKAITKLEGEEKMGKLDDLADCLLQGMAWVEWENNKRIVMKHGIEALLDT
ncbi:hypothetical protein IFR04_004272 [Cadophora malorum]|uniref:SAP domain-containing protein n=1 Tax=Cadophora malorum TaxID=108018 RepID=A0A8H7WD47_9HELO|nr:hypothetical protein IFR04_004272 [Cadophora malorum]